MLGDVLTWRCERFERDTWMETDSLHAAYKVHHALLAMLTGDMKRKLANVTPLR